jgi:thymidine kinase
MFAGKTKRLMEEVSRKEAVGLRVLVINHASDTRFAAGGAIASHSGTQRHAVMSERLTTLNLLDEKESDVVAIDEAQFFPDLLEVVTALMASDVKEVIVAGLSGDFERKPIGQLLWLSPLASKEILLHALCAECGEDAPFTKKIAHTHNVQQIEVGGADLYKPVCHRHFF